MYMVKAMDGLGAFTSIHLSYFGNMYGHRRCLWQGNKHK